MEIPADLNALGATIRQARRSAGLTQEDLSALVGISDRTLRHIEQGSQSPSIGAVASVAHALGLRLAVQP